MKQDNGEGIGRTIFLPVVRDIPERGMDTGTAADIRGKRGRSESNPSSHVATVANFYPPVILAFMGMTNKRRLGLLRATRQT
jgi:hypothetical protein